MPFQIISHILRITYLYRLPKERYIGTAEQVLHCIPPALVYLFLCFCVIIYTWCAVTIQVKCHSHHLHTATGLPAFMQTLCFYTSCLKIINVIDISSCIITDTEAIAKYFVVHILILHLFVVVNYSCNRSD